MLTLSSLAHEFTAEVDRSTVALTAAADMAAGLDAENEDAYRVACTAAQTALKARETSGRCVWLSGINGSRLIQVARREEAGCLVLPDKERFLKTEGLDRVLDEIECPIVLTG